MSIHREVRHFIVEHFLFGEDDAELSGDQSLTDHGVIDSSGVLELVEFLEETYGIQIENEELVPANLDTLNRLAELVARKQQT